MVWKFGLLLLALATALMAAAGPLLPRGHPKTVQQNKRVTWTVWGNGQTACGPHGGQLDIENSISGDVAWGTEACGDKIQITYKNSSVTGTVVDLGTGGGGQLTVSRTLFRHFADTDIGFIRADYVFI
ncbi:unnamed protein product [Parajaminaea phylloscopi]